MKAFENTKRHCRNMLTTGMVCGLLAFPTLGAPFDTLEEPKKTLESIALHETVAIDEKKEAKKIYYNNELIGTSSWLDAAFYIQQVTTSRDWFDADLYWRVKSLHDSEPFIDERVNLLVAVYPLFDQTDYDLVVREQLAADAKRHNTYDVPEERRIFNEALIAFGEGAFGHAYDGFCLTEEVSELSELSVRYQDLAILKKIRHHVFGAGKQGAFEVQKWLEEKLGEERGKYEGKVEEYLKYYVDASALIDNIQEYSSFDWDQKELDRVLNLLAPYEPLIADAAEKQNLPTALLRSIVIQESMLAVMYYEDSYGYEGFRKRFGQELSPETIESPVGAIGLMQIMPSTGEIYGCSKEDLRDPKKNIDLGAQYIKQQLVRFNFNVPHALAAYNAGPGIVHLYGGIPPYSETRYYVQSVIGFAKHFSEQANAEIAKLDNK